MTSPPCCWDIYTRSITLTLFSFLLILFCFHGALFVLCFFVVFCLFCLNTPSVQLRPMSNSPFFSLALPGAGTTDFPTTPSFKPQFLEAQICHIKRPSIHSVSSLKELKGKLGSYCFFSNDVYQER